MVFLFLAGACYLLPFYLPFLWPLIIFYPTALFCALLREPPRRLLAFWAISVTFIQLLPLCIALVRMAYGPIWLTFLPSFLLITYVSLWLFAWLLITQLGLRNCRSFISALMLWTILLWIHLFLIEYALLWPLGQLKGYLFLNPLLPLSNAPSLLAPLKIFCLPMVLLDYCFLTSSITLLLCRHYPIPLLLFTLSWAASTFLTESPHSPLWLTSVAHLPLMLPANCSINAGTACISFECAHIMKEHPSVHTIILPESSWNSSALTSTKLFESGVDNLLIGSFAEENQQRFNSLYYYKNGFFKERIDKRQVIPVVEQEITWVNFLSPLFFATVPPSSSSCLPRKRIKIPEIGYFVPYICSELYCNSEPDDPWKDPILAICNDTWFPSSFQKLMALGARFRAIQWRRPILYISYHYACYFDSSGNASPIASSNRTPFL